VPYALQFEELVVDLVAELPEVGEVLDAVLVGKRRHLGSSQTR